MFTDCTWLFSTELSEIKVIRRRISYQIFWNTAKIWDIEQRLNDINRSVPCYPNIESLKKQHATLHLSTLSTHCRILFGNVMHHHVAWTCLHVEVKFFHEREVFFLVFCGKSERESGSSRCAGANYRNRKLEAKDFEEVYTWPTSATNKTKNKSSRSIKAQLLEANLGYVHTIADIFPCRYEKLPSIVWTPIRYVTLHFRNRRETASLRYRNRAEITVVTCEQNPYPVWLSWRCESYL